VWAVVAAAKVASPRQTIENKIRKRLLVEMVTHLNDNTPAIVDKTKADARDHLHGIAREFRSVLTSKVQSVRDELSAALDAKNKGEQEVRTRHERINRQLRELDTINRSLDAIVDRVVALDEGLKPVFDATFEKDDSQMVL
jgi:hypothetical protein